jgi:purine-cytosine permease-like protein
MTKPKIAFAGRQVPLPRSRILRISLGIALILGGLVGFLPILGFWMVPLGIIVLSVDLAIARRLRRRTIVWWGRRRHMRRVTR